MRKVWTEEEVRFLIEQYHTAKATDIAEQLGRSVKQVRNKVQYLGLRKRDVGEVEVVLPEQPWPAWLGGPVPEWQGTIKAHACRGDGI